MVQQLRAGFCGLVAVLASIAASAAVADERAAAALRDYANILFLTQMFGAPAAAPPAAEPCADALNPIARAALVEGLSELSTLGSWPLLCAPVGVTLIELPGGGLAATLRYLDILDDGGWIATLKQDVARGRPSVASPNAPLLAGLLARLSKRASERDVDILVGELTFGPGN